MNSQWQIDLYNDLEKAITMQDVLDYALKTTKKFGFESAGWRTEIPLPMSNRTTLAINTIEDDVVEKHANGGYDNAPVPLHCSQTIEPIYWLGTMNDDMYSKVPDLCDEYYGWGHYGG
ncbi:autoinducer binding domain-containing protein [Zymobacter palmae]|uniref:autoinducer binding domain-containing protein n=1 Tax=Zymobacter palmae TaxID=33074 RepID=UPI0011AE676A|nr:autoinducer binding domain-containing protein [Zymobacter palmae]